MEGTSQGRFDYVKYDEHALALQGNFKLLTENLEVAINKGIVSPRAKALALTKLEEVYMWIGKGVRDDQTKRSSSTVPNESRDPEARDA